MASSTSRTFIDFAVIGVVLAFYHAWSEGLFTSNLFIIQYAPWASFFGTPYSLFGVVWFPVVLAVGLWSTRLSRIDLKRSLLLLLTVGNLFTMYFWYVDVAFVKAYNPLYLGLYVTNYALTGLVVFQNRSDDVVQGFAYGTVVGAAVGLIFGLFGVTVCGILGGILGSTRNLALPRQRSVAAPQPTS